MTAGIEAALAADGVAVVGPVGTDADAVRLARVHRPDVCLLDAGWPAAFGAVVAVRSVSPGTVVLLLGACDDERTLTSAMRAGACGYLSKEVHLGRIAAVLRAAAAGELIVPRHLVGALAAQAEGGARVPVVPRQRTAALTQRETEVLALLVEGHSTAAIARRLYVAPVTVRTHVAAIMRKAGVHDREALRHLGAP